MRKRLLIKNARVVLPGRTLKRGWLLAEDGIIAAFEYGDPPDYSDAEVIRGEGLTLLPGFIDLHAHGGNGFDVMEGNAEALHGMARFFAAGGVTSFLATTWTDTGANITRALKAVADAMNSPAGGAQLLGAHLEGPFLNPKRCGAQHSSLIRRADLAEARPWLEMNVIRLLALAPEYEGNHWLIREAAKRGGDGIGGAFGRDLWSNDRSRGLWDCRTPRIASTRCLRCTTASRAWSAPC